MAKPEFIIPNWPAPDAVNAYSTTRRGGASLPPFDSFNFGTHVGDNMDAVAQNRQHLIHALSLPSSPHWLNQVHGTQVIHTDQWESGCDADACYSKQIEQVCTIMTADCLPVLFCDKSGTQVAAAHAGWRGLLNGVLEQTLAQFTGPKANIMAWLGPAIGPEQFEVGNAVFEAFAQQNNDNNDAFTRIDADHLLANIYALAIKRLHRAGVTAIYGGDRCTVTEQQSFFSYRRDGRTGRMASLIWISKK